jgi:hypothetical protein
MRPTIEALATYLHLARISGQRQRPHVRDRLLVVAGVVASARRLPRIAALCRHLILEHNPHHLIGHWATVEEGLESPDFVHYLRHLMRRFGLERVEQMLSEAGVELAGERRAYFSDEEYAAALLGWDLAQVSDHFGDAP